MIAGLERYFETATLFWLLMEGWFLHELICIKPLEVQTSIKRYVIIGWGEYVQKKIVKINGNVILKIFQGVPVIVTLPWLVYHVYSPFNDVYWVKHDITVYIIAISIFITFLVKVFHFYRNLCNLKIILSPF